MICYNKLILQKFHDVPKTVEMANKNYKGIKSKIDKNIPKDYFILKKVFKT